MEYHQFSDSSRTTALQRNVSGFGHPSSLIEVTGRMFRHGKSANLSPTVHPRRYGLTQPGDGTSRNLAAIVSKSSEITSLLGVRASCCSFTCIAA